MSPPITRAQSLLGSPPGHDVGQLSNEPNIHNMLEQLLGGMNEIRSDVGKMQGDMDRVQGELTTLFGEVASLKQESERGSSSSRHRRRRKAPINRGVGYGEDDMSDDPAWGEQHHFEPRRRNNYRDHQRNHQYHQPRDRHQEDEYEDPLKNTRHNLPEFLGKFDPEAYLEWESRVEKIYSLHRYTERDKVRLAIIEFRGYADTWWSDVMRRRRNQLEGEVGTWAELTVDGEKKAKFVQDLHLKVQANIQR